MKILWVKSDFVIPADTGGKIRSYNIIRQLAKLHLVTYLSFIDQNYTSQHEAGMQVCVQEVISVFKRSEKKYGFGFYLRLFLGLFSSLPYIVHKYHSARIKRIIGELWKQRRFDILICDFLEMSVNLEKNTVFPKVLFQHNVESAIWDRYYQVERNWLKRLYFFYERRRMRKYEAFACQRFDRVLAVSQADKLKLEGEFGIHDIAVIPTGVDTEYFASRKEKTVPGSLVFTGSMDWLPNQDAISYFCEEIFPLVKRQVPEAKLWVVGRNPSDRILELSQKNENIIITGTVEDVRPYMVQAQIYIVPLRVGGGTRIKIFEAMAMGLPVISTSIGAEGLDITPDKNIVIGDGAEDFADGIIELLRNESKRNKIAEEGRRLVTQTHDWKRVAQILSRVCEEVIHSFGKRKEH